jgi:hypothetical protein
MKDQFRIVEKKNLPNILKIKISLLFHYRKKNNLQMLLLEKSSHSYLQHKQGEILRKSKEASILTQRRAQ